jgi:hypothetical protein
MNSSQNSVNPRSSIFTSLCSGGKFQSLTKVRDLGTMKTSEATPNQYASLISMAAGHQKIGRRTSEHLRKKDTREPPTKDSCRAAKEAARRIGAKVVVEALIHLNLCTACTMAVKPTTTPKIAPFSLSQKEKWSKIPPNLRSNLHPEKSITQCNPPPTSNILHNQSPIIRFFHRNPTRTPKPNLQHTTNPTIMLQPITCNLRQSIE